jgi:hypothetical protein
VLPNGSVKLSAQIDRLQYSVNGLGEMKGMIQNVVIDSDQDVAPERSRENLLKSTLKQYVGDVGSVTRNERGEVTDFSLSKKLSELLQSPLAREYSGLYGDLFTQNGLGRRLTNWLVAFPAKPVPNGHTWTQDLSGRFSEGSVNTRHFKLIGTIVEDGQSVAQVDFTSKVKVGDNAAWKISSQKGSGKVILDRKTHWVRRFALSEQIEATGGESGMKMNTVYSASLGKGGDEKPAARDELK